MNGMLRLLLLLCYSINFAIADCALSLKNNFKAPQPIVLQENNVSMRTSILYPDTNSIFRIERGQRLIIACADSAVKIDGLNFPSILPMLCIQGSSFQTPNHLMLNVRDVSCTKSPAVQLQVAGRENGYVKLAVRFSSLSLPPQIVHYFNYVSKITAFSMYKIVATVKGQTNCWQSSHFSEDDYYDDLEDYMRAIYRKSEQRKTINSLLGLPATDDKYISLSGELFLARGHLAANCDFVYEVQQKATYSYVNVVPQWQSFNNGNWRRLENDLRNYADRNKLPLFIVAGALGVLKLPHNKTQRPTELYLSKTSSPNSHKAVPVPKFMFKLAFDVSRARGAVFIGMNNPYQERVEYICEDKSEQMRWLTWENNNPVKGFSYACTIRDFRLAVRNLPFKEEATGGLLI